MLQSNTQLEMYIFGQVTRKQKHFETFDTAKIYNATFKIIPYSNNSFVPDHYATVREYVAHQTGLDWWSKVGFI